MMDILLQYHAELLYGLLTTLGLVLASITLGLSCAIALTAIHFSEQWFSKKCASLLVFFVTGTPLLVQLFLIYYGLAQFEWIRTSYWWIVLKHPAACAIIAIALNTACYTSILLVGAVHSVPQNEKDACAALGMSKWLAWRRIIFPRAFRLALPAYSNEVIIVLKSTSLASTITLLDIMGVTQQLVTYTYDTVSLYLLAGGIYLTLNAILMRLFQWIEKTENLVK